MDEVPAGPGENFGQASQPSPAKVRTTAAIQDNIPEDWLPHKYMRLDNTGQQVLEDMRTPAGHQLFDVHAQGAEGQGWRHEVPR
mmetsp:Transcript_44985/g.139958  ORF Transcript_44985/g.139958 Transcript_44985/m.139958 type:complete len:84 (+) Transcript_44985:196-447(+)